MFSPSYASTINPDEERSPPPPATAICLPQIEVQFRSDENWHKHLPNLFKKYSHIIKPSDLRLDHLLDLNLEIKNDVELEELIPKDSEGVLHLPPRASGQTITSTKHLDPKVTLTSPAVGFAANRDSLLSNGIKAPELETYIKFTKELGCENDDALRVVWRKKARPGHAAPALSQYRKFWGHLESLFLYWDSSLDHYYELNETPQENSGTKSPRGLKRLSVVLGHKDAPPDATKPDSNKRYKGRRTSTGSKMPEHFRIDSVRSFVEPLAWIFGCQLVNPRKTPHMEVRNLLVPVTQTSQVWRIPQDKAGIKRGISEGPILGIQCRAETGFIKDNHAATLDSAREIAGLVLLAQERAREGKPKEIPGKGKWYTTKPRWGGGPGGEFGEAEGNTDPTHHSMSGTKSHSRRHSFPSAFSSSQSNSEERIWKELKPGPGLWDARHTYLAIGKDRGEQFDNVFMISSLFHHIAILKLHVHPLYVEFLVSGKGPSSAPPEITWSEPQIQRSRWFDLLEPEDRVEAMRGLWGVMSYSMRAGESAGGAAGRRQKSEVHHHFSFRKKAHAESDAAPTNRSASVAF